MSQIDLNNLEEPYDRAKNYLIIVITFFVVPTYLLVIFMLEWNFSREMPQETRPEPWVISNLNHFVILSIGVSVTILILTHTWWIKKFLQNFNLSHPYEKWSHFYAMLMVNLLILVFGLFVCMLPLVWYHTLNWYYLVGYFSVGWGNLLYIYGWKTPAIYRKFSLKSPAQQALQQNT